MSSTPIRVVMVLLSLVRPIVLARSGSGAPWAGRQEPFAHTPAQQRCYVLNLEPSGAAARALSPEISLGFQQVLGVPRTWRFFRWFEKQGHPRLVQPLPSRFLDFAAAQRALLVSADQPRPIDCDRAACCCGDRGTGARRRGAAGRAGRLSPGLRLSHGSTDPGNGLPQWDALLEVPVELHDAITDGLQLVRLPRVGQQEVPAMATSGTGRDVQPGPTPEI
jgi:hypothetical protein